MIRQNIRLTHTYFEKCISRGLFVVDPHDRVIIIDEDASTKVIQHSFPASIFIISYCCEPFILSAYEYNILVNFGIKDENGIKSSPFNNNSHDLNLSCGGWLNELHLTFPQDIKELEQESRKIINAFWQSKFLPAMSDDDIVCHKINYNNLNINYNKA